jgi:thiol-disulfide isomerase/thioredoxin
MIRFKFFIIILFCVINAQGQILKVGTKAPALVLDKWVKPDKAVNLTHKPLIIDFWATWCAPCLETIPHLNELTTNYQSEINFLAITTDSYETTVKFLKKVSITANVVLDKNKATNKAFNIQFLPTTILIDKDGIIQWYGSPQNLNKEAIDEFLNTGLVTKIPVGFNDKLAGISTNTNEVTANKDQQPLHQLKISEGKKTGGFIAKSSPKKIPALIMVRDKSLSFIIQNLYNITNARYDFQSAKDVDLNVDLKSQFMSTEGAIASLIKDLKEMYHISIDTAYQTKLVWEVHVTDYSKLKLRETALTSKESSIIGFKDNDTLLDMKGGSLPDLLHILEDKFKIPFELQKRGSDDFRYDLQIKCENLQQLEDELKLLGIIIRKESKKITITVVKDNL